MSALYRVFLSVEVVAALRRCRGEERRKIVLLLESLAENPHQPGDYAERDGIGRPVQVRVIGRHAVCYWPDHAVCEVKILDLRQAGN